jgi:hypothetical protein
MQGILQYDGMVAKGLAGRLETINRGRRSVSNDAPIQFDPVPEFAFDPASHLHNVTFVEASKFA